MTDRELLEAAAKAAGMETRWDQPRGGRKGVVRARVPGSGDAFPVWNPLTDDGDALRLAVKLCLRVQLLQLAGGTARVERMDPWQDFYETSNDGPYAATRRAIVRAAAAMVKP